MNRLLPARFAFPALALAGLLGSAVPADAAWDNVFQVTCDNCRPRQRSSYYATPDACCAPQKPQQRVEYKQRSYYEPITVMKPEKYLEPVEVRSKSFYWEPVTAYSYSSYYDPCTGSCQQIAVPKTAYKLKEQCNTSMKYVERVRMVPTQSQRLVTEMQPVVTYYYPPTRSYSSPVTEACELPTAPPVAGPRVDELRSTPPTATPDAGDMIPPTNLPTNPGVSKQRAMPPQAKPLGSKGFANTTSRGAVRGEVVLNDQITPRGSAKLVFVNADDLKVREYVQADEFGNFDANLPAGEWHMYIGNGNGRAMFHKTIQVKESASREFRVVSR